jgi:hypothetical protein
MKWAILILFVLLLCQGAISGWTDLTFYEEQSMQNAHRALLHARTDSLEAYIATLWVKVDRLEVLAGL